MHKKLYFLLLPLFLFAQVGHTQKILQIERYGKAKTQKIFIGQPITYQLKDAREYGWYTGVIEDYMVDDNLIVFKDRLINIDNIHSLKYERGWPSFAKYTLGTFGLAWSGFALIGTATDGDPTTSYRWSDALVTGTSLLFGLGLPKLFGTKKIKFGKRKRLRMLDLRVINPNQ